MMRNTVPLTQVLPGLFVGTVEDSFDRFILAKEKVTHILNVASELDINERVDLVYKKIALDDDSYDDDIRDILPESLKFIDSALKNNGIIIVHCLEGKSRSICVILAYMILFCNVGFTESLEYLKQIRPIIDIFPQYLEQTRLFCC